MKRENSNTYPKAILVKTRKPSDSPAPAMYLLLQVVKDLSSRKIISVIKKEVNVSVTIVGISW